MPHGLQTLIVRPLDISVASEGHLEAALPPSSPGLGRFISAPTMSQDHVVTLRASEMINRSSLGSHSSAASESHNLKHGDPGASELAAAGLGSFTEEPPKSVSRGPRMDEGPVSCY
jgi:hypothetical protein